MRILAVNCGSSSLKSALIDTATHERLLQISVDNIGKSVACLYINGKAHKLDADINADTAMATLLHAWQAQTALLASAAAVVHRIVHGGERFVQPTLIDESTLAALTALNAFAPLHNPPAIAAIKHWRAALPGLPQIAVFDTAFHASLPAQARTYALPLALTQRLGIRRFGFHGLSHAHVMQAAALHLQRTPQQLRIISCHLGNGASVAAIEYGRSVETSMGMTPLEGLVMGTRVGDIDCGVLLQLLRSGEFDVDSLDALLNQQSGLLGLTGTQDMRNIEERAARGDAVCDLAVNVYAHRVRKYIGAYAAVMGGVEVIAFTGGVGEHSVLMRNRIAQRLEFLGTALDELRNREVALTATIPTVPISTLESRTALLVIKANEEMAMALDAAALLAGVKHTTHQH